MREKEDTRGHERFPIFVNKYSYKYPVFVKWDTGSQAVTSRTSCESPFTSSLTNSTLCGDRMTAVARAPKWKTGNVKRGRKELCDFSYNQSD